MISILTPTRKRPDRLWQMYDSAKKTADNPEDIELVFYTDNDDYSYDDLILTHSIRIPGKRISISEAWNECWKEATGDILGLVGDDVVFRTKGWDTKIKKIFNEYPDKITYVFGDDGTAQGPYFGTHGFIHQNWAQAVGYFVPPYFSANQVDRWLNDVAQALGRLRFGDIKMEHMHHAHGKAEFDDTYKEAIPRHAENEQIWKDTEDKRRRDIEILRRLING